MEIYPTPETAAEWTTRHSEDVNTFLAEWENGFSTDVETASSLAMEYRNYVYKMTGTAVNEEQIRAYLFITGRKHALAGNRCDCE